MFPLFVSVVQTVWDCAAVAFALIWICAPVTFLKVVVLGEAAPRVQQEARPVLIEPRLQDGYIYSRPFAAANNFCCFQSRAFQSRACRFYSRVWADVRPLPGV